MTTEVPQHLGYWFGTLTKMRARMHSRAAREGKSLTQFVYPTADPEVSIWSYSELPSRLVTALHLGAVNVIIAKPIQNEFAEPDYYALALQQRDKQAAHA